MAAKEQTDLLKKFLESKYPESGYANSHGDAAIKVIESLQGQIESRQEQVDISIFWQSQFSKLKNCREIQCVDGTWDYDPYMQGMANGLILSVAVMEDKEPKYLEAPAKWRSKIEQSDG